MGKVFLLVILLFIVCEAYLLIYSRGSLGFQKELEVPRITSDVDKDSDGVDDYTDIVLSARSQIGVVTSYDAGYYGNGGFPPDDTGACTDVIWRALGAVGYDIKSLLERDIRAHPERYDTTRLSDANINFRRTENLRRFFSFYAQELTTDVEPGNEANLFKWQGGDIVTFEQGIGNLGHIAIVSDKRRPDGVPLLINNHGFGVVEDDLLLSWPTKISGHFRLKGQAKPTPQEK